MFSPSDYNDAVPQFTNGDYANSPMNPLYVAEPGAVDYNRGMEPIQTLPAQWWNWLCNQITAKLNKLNVYVKNIFDELAQLLSLVGVTPDATEEEITVGQLKDAFGTKYPVYLNNNFSFESVLQDRTRGVLMPPADSWDNATDTLTLTGGFGVIDSNKKVSFATSSLVFTNDNAVHYIVADEDGVVTIENTLEADVILVGLCHNKEYCLLSDNNPNQGKERIFFEKWYGENCIRKDLVTNLQTYYGATVPITTNIIINSVITASLLQNVTLENCNLTVNETTSATASSLIAYVTMNNCNISVITNFNNVTSKALFSNVKLNYCTITVPINYMVIFSGLSKLNNCTINAERNSGTVVDDATLYNCVLNVNTNNNMIIDDGELYNCYIKDSNAGGFSAGTSYFIVGDNTAMLYGCYIRATGSISGNLENCLIDVPEVATNSDFCQNATFNNCNIIIGSNYGYGINSGTFDNCKIEIKSTPTGTDIGYDKYNTKFYNCRIYIRFDNGTADHGIVGGVFNNCYISGSSRLGQTTPQVKNTSDITFNFTDIEDAYTTTLSSTQGKMNILNGVVFHTS